MSTTTQQRARARARVIPASPPPPTTIHFTCSLARSPDGEILLLVLLVRARFMPVLCCAVPCLARAVNNNRSTNQCSLSSLISSTLCGARRGGCRSRLDHQTDGRTGRGEGSQILVMLIGCRDMDGAERSAASQCWTKEGREGRNSSACGARLASKKGQPLLFRRPRPAGK